VAAKKPPAKKTGKKKGMLFGKPRGEVVKHPGSFKAAAKKAGKSVDEEAASVLKPGSKASSEMKEKAGAAKAFKTMRKKKATKKP
jgi:hypothetical protein